MSEPADLRNLATNAATSLADGSRPETDSSSSAATEYAIRIGGAIVVTIGAAVLALMEAFLVPTRIGGVPIPIAAVIAFFGNYYLPALAKWWVNNRWAALLPIATWFAVVLVASTPNSSGSLIIINTWPGYIMLLAGAAGAAAALFKHLMAPRRRLQPRP